MAKVVHLRNIKRALKLAPSESVQYLISGRVSNFRAYKSLNFVDLIDGSTNQHLQVIIKRDLLKKPELGSYLTCLGNVAASRGPKQPTEFKVSKVEFASECNPDRWPLTSSKSDNPMPGSWWRKHLHLRPQASHFASLLRVRSELELSLHMIFKQMDFFKVHTPTLTSNDSEASSDLFLVQRSQQVNGESSSANDHLQQDSDSDLNDDGDNDDDNYDDETSSSSRISDGGNQVGGEQLAQRRRRDVRADYFNKDVFMATSAQLHLESLAASLSRVYCLSSTFRAENSLSRRHLCEFTMLEAEEANVTRLEPLMERVESVVKFSAQFVSDISEFSGDFHALLDKYSNRAVFERVAHSRAYIRMTYQEALAVLRELHSHSSTTGRLLLADGLALSQCQHGCDITPRHERHLLEHCDNVPIFITNYPRSLKPFYMKPLLADGAGRAASGGQMSTSEHNNSNSPNDDGASLHELVSCFDLIAPLGGEICGGSLREDNLERLRESLKLSASRQRLHDNLGQDNQIMMAQDLQRQRRQRLSGAENQHNSNHNSFQWYLDLREFGSFPHGGFGIGFERLIQSLVGIRNIRDTLAFPRWPGSCAM